MAKKFNARFNKVFSFTRFMTSVFMEAQAIKYMLYIDLAVFFSIFLLGVFITSYWHDWYLSGLYIVGWLSHKFPLMGMFGDNHIFNFVYQGHHVSQTALELIQNPNMPIAMDNVKWISIKCGIFAFIVALVVHLFMGWWFVRDGDKRTQEEFVEGYELLRYKEYNKYLKKEGKRSSFLKFQKITLPLIAERRNILLKGVSGSGKSNVIKNLVKCIENHAKVSKDIHTLFIYDEGCVLVDRFYRAEDGDILLNPMDSRGIYWDMWEDAKIKTEVDALAVALMPNYKGGSDPFWIKAARMIIC